MVLNWGATWLLMKTNSVPLEIDHPTLQSVFEAVWVLTGLARFDLWPDIFPKLLLNLKKHYCNDTRNILT